MGKVSVQISNTAVNDAEFSLKALDTRVFFA